MKAEKKSKIINILLLSAFAVIIILLLAPKIINKIKAEHEYKLRLASASSNAERYIREKYGFETENMNDEAYDLVNKASDNYMLLIAEVNGSDILIFADTSSEDPYCADNYQYWEIKNAVADEILKILPAGNVVDISWDGFETDDSLPLKNLFNTYFDGENVEEFTEIGHGYVEMIFADKNILESDILERLKKMNIDYMLTLFDTAERLEEFNAASSDGTSYSKCKKFAPYITDHLEIEDGVEKHGLNISFQSCGDFIYTYFPTENKGFPESREITIEEAHPDYFIQHYEWYGEEEYVSAPITNAYICSDGWDIYIYYPLEKLKDYDIENIGAAWYSGGGQTNDRGIEKPSVCGDYAVFRLPFNKISFMFVDTSGYDEYIPGWAKR